ncbi:hypothetical protein IP91_04039 [Pseudoduganella lurida]|uniref:Alpha/beta fold hydrolase n=1 Tax=Pseudoduganella lurida TaxID=1036180 RepID=A0A562R0C2_9BURK|nr:alpha/beta fold hydrolase [Pseudoduganella lurida]TWI62519.1 hypothetical protein IP91_04039 [Pseudoduganella lurida]
MSIYRIQAFPPRLLSLALAALLASGCTTAVTGVQPASQPAAASGSGKPQAPLVLRTMGSLYFGGTVTRAADGETFHGDHGYAQYYIPEHARTLPIVMWHGIGQSGRSFESTPDGREGFMSILPRRDWPVYIIDQPRRGRAGRTQAQADSGYAVPTTLRESAAWDAFRVGVWTPPKPAHAFPGVQMPLDPATVDQFFRQQTPDTGTHPFTAEHRAFMGRTVGELFRQVGPAVLLTHSHSGQYGWSTAMNAPDLVKAVVAYEPGQFAFPEGERPPEIVSVAEGVREAMEPQMVSQAQFQKLTRMPIIIIYGDYISPDPSPVFNVDLWRVASARARQFVDAVNRHGGDAQLIILPQLGIKGNSHAPFADLNNVEIADHLEKFLGSKRLDGRATPHAGPRRPAISTNTIPLETF